MAVLDGQPPDLRRREGLEVGELRGAVEADTAFLLRPPQPGVCGGGDVGPICTVLELGTTSWKQGEAGFGCLQNLFWRICYEINPACRSTETQFVSE